MTPIIFDLGLTDDELARLAASGECSYSCRELTVTVRTDGTGEITIPDELVAVVQGVIPRLVRSDIAA